MDYLEEQTNEAEALESIYYNEYKLLNSSPFVFTISVKSDKYNEEGEEGLFANLKFELTPTYPEEIPLVSIFNEEDEDPETNMEPEDVVALIKLIKDLASENLGMVMVYTLVTAATEWLNTRWETLERERDEEAERKLFEEEEAERHRFDGTRVTPESFAAWKAVFDHEMSLKKKIDIEKEIASKKLNGRELFMKDTTLNESDLKFVEEGDDMPIDESLFEDLDGLDLDDDDDDDEDYVPGEDSDDD